jgi:hypothetical protein
MAQRQGVIVMHHPDLPGREIEAIDEKQARVFAKSGWKQGKAKAALKAEEK